MFFLFGIDYFQLKSFSFQELELPVDSQKRKYTIDLVEVYFHILRIPVFSLGKKLKLGWYGDYFRVPVEIMARIDLNRVNAKRKWYAFTGIYISLLFLGLFFMSQEVNRREQIRLKTLHKKEIRAFLMNPRIGDLYYFSSTNYDLQAEIHAFTEDSLCFTIRSSFELRKLINQKLSDEEKLNQLIGLSGQRNFLNDSLRTIYPQEPLLRDMCALQIMDHTFRLKQLLVEKTSVIHSFCLAEVCKIPRQMLFSPYSKETFYLNEIERDEKSK